MSVGQGVGLSKKEIKRAGIVAGIVLPIVFIGITSLVISNNNHKELVESGRVAGNHLLMVTKAAREVISENTASFMTDIAPLAVGETIVYSIEKDPSTDIDDKWRAKIPLTESLRNNFDQAYKLVIRKESLDNQFDAVVTAVVDDKARRIGAVGMQSAISVFPSYARGAAYDDDGALEVFRTATKKQPTQDWVKTSSHDDFRNLAPVAWGNTWGAVPQIGSPAAYMALEKDLMLAAKADIEQKLAAKEAAEAAEAQKLAAPAPVVSVTTSPAINALSEPANDPSPIPEPLTKPLLADGMIVTGRVVTERLCEPANPENCISFNQLKSIVSLFDFAP